MIELANFKVNFDEVAVAASSKKRDYFWENQGFGQKTELFKSQLGYYIETYQYLRGIKGKLTLFVDTR